MGTIGNFTLEPGTMCQQRPAELPRSAKAAKSKKALDNEMHVRQKRGYRGAYYRISRKMKKCDLGSICTNKAGAWPNAKMAVGAGGEGGGTGDSSGSGWRMISWEFPAFGMLPALEVAGPTEHLLVERPLCPRQQIQDGIMDGVNFGGGRRWTNLLFD